MTIKELNDFVYIKKSIKEVKNEIEELSNLGSAPMNSMPKSNSLGNPTQKVALRKIKLEERLNNLVENYIDKLTKINDFIDSIENEEIKLIIRLKFIRGVTWYEVAEIISGTDKYLDRSTPRKKLFKYFERQNIKK